MFIYDNNNDDVEPEELVTSRKSSIFAIYAKVFRVMLTKLVPKINLLEEKERNRELEDLVLPSDKEWRYRVYYSLVDLQREYDAETTSEKDDAESEEIEPVEDWEWNSESLTYPLRVKKARSISSTNSQRMIYTIGGSMTEARVEPGWRLNDILLASRVLEKNASRPIYNDEAEMRRVLGLVYDVLRYKKLLNRALEDVKFWRQNCCLKNRERVVWLLLYDLQGRKFARIGDENALRKRDQAFRTADLKDIENILLASKIRLAASISRLRIGGSALNLDELLPLHLRNGGRVIWKEDGSAASGYVNTIKLPSKIEFVNELTHLELHPVCGSIELDVDCYIVDSACPKMINFHEEAREKLAVSDLVRARQFVFLNRSLCLGAALVAQSIRYARLCGPVVLTHSIAPRHTGYLAGLLTDIENAGRLLAFGAGNKRCEYESYLNELGITAQQCRVFSEKYVTPPPSSEMERATIVLATPPCSCTGLRDVVDLAVARGGDSDLLESLTNTENEKQSHELLSDQLATLKYALTRPNVQLLIYEAHTVLPSETTEMIQKVVEYANGLAVEKHIYERVPKKKSSAKDTTLKSSKSSKTSKSGQKSPHPDRPTTPLPEEDPSSVAPPEIPDSDLFEISSIDEICDKKSSEFFDPGCFLAVIKRKEMMQFNSLFMIKEAEAKGLFGDPKKPKPQKDESVVVQKTPLSDIHCKRTKIEIDRIAAPTLAFNSKISMSSLNCLRYDRHLHHLRETIVSRMRNAKRRDVRRWWAEMITYVLYSREYNEMVRPFRPIRTDPLTKRVFYSPRIKKIIFSANAPAKVTVKLGIAEIESAESQKATIKTFIVKKKKLN